MVAFIQVIPVRSVLTIISKFAYWEGMRRDVGVPRYFTICVHFHVWLFVFTKTETLAGHSDAVWPMGAAANPFSFGNG